MKISLVHKGIVMTKMEYCIIIRAYMISLSFHFSMHVLTDEAFMPVSNSGTGHAILAGPGRIGPRVN